MMFRMSLWPEPHAQHRNVFEVRLGGQSTRQNGGCLRAEDEGQWLEFLSSIQTVIIVIVGN